AMGKYFDDVKDFDNAFLNYQLANELTKRHTPSYDRRQLTQAVDLIVHHFDQQWATRPRLNAATSSRPVFIVGTPRSGTTLAEQILASHPDVFGAGELLFWSTACESFDSTLVSGELRQSAADTRAQDYLRLLEHLSADALRVIDKMPGNFLALGLIHEALPNARIIHMRRNPIDTCLSIYFQDFATVHPYASDLEDLAHYYSEYSRLMRHWRATLPAHRLIEVPYEGLLGDLEGWSRQMLDFIALPWDPRCLEFHRIERPVTTASRWQVRQPLNSASVERWRSYEKFIAPLLGLAALE
ncbi:MAG TPA: sulfotransferase, partial [Steroidobacteraceae bacterium]